MDFFVYSRAAPGAAEAASAPGLREAHWAYMDQFAGGMIARGPTLSPDRETWTGSVHVLSLADVDAVKAFVETEPYHLGGLYDTHLLRRYENRLGRTMWETAAGSSDPRFLALMDTPEPPDLTDLGPLSLCGRLMTLEGSAAGAVVALQAPWRLLLTARLDGDVHDWEHGGRR